ncbi:hypothetical protein Ddc_16051 [Ditylenchus destructor]|nr:hypothetical protein Ddc_16051 [Ditylenchus destructor]
MVPLPKFYYSTIKAATVPLTLCLHGPRSASPALVAIRAARPGEALYLFASLYQRLKICTNVGPLKTAGAQTSRHQKIISSNRTFIGCLVLNHLALSHGGTEPDSAKTTK